MAVIATLLRLGERLRLVPYPAGTLTLDDVMDEYARGVLEDAARDPALAEVIDRYTDDVHAEAVARRIDPGRVNQRVFLTGWAYGLIDQSTHPGTTLAPPPYGGYSSVMLRLAALCRYAITRRILNP